MENLKTTKCECGYIVGLNDMKPGFLDPKKLGVEMDGFYGGMVTNFVLAKCNCGKEYVLYLRPANNTFDIIDMAKFTHNPKKKGAS